MSDGAEPRIFGAALILGAAVLVGLGLGAAFSPPGSARALSVPALALQTLLTVGALPRRERSVELRPGLVLLGLHMALASLPSALVALAIGLDDPLGFGLFLVAAAPPAALIPAYADVAEVPGTNLLVFVLIAYGVGLVLTPALVFLAAGELVGVGPIALTLGAGLVAPAVLARVLHPQIARIPQRVRRGLVNASVLVICFGLGGEVVDSVGSADVTAVGVAVVVAALVLRSAGGAAVATAVGARGPQGGGAVRRGVQEHRAGRRHGRFARRSGRRAARPRRVPGGDAVLPLPGAPASPSDRSLCTVALRVVASRDRG